MNYCHSNDRENLVAIGECGYQGTSNTNWQNAVNARLEIDTFAQRMGEQ